MNPGISGQVTAQMLLRMQQDVVQLQPIAVAILSGTNDIANMLQLTTPESIEDNWRSMAEIAQANGISPVFCSTLPTHTYTSRAVNSVRSMTGRDARVKHLARGLRTQPCLPFVDYTPAMSDEHGLLRRDFSEDGIHPNAAGYAAMQTVLEPVLDNLAAEMM